MKVHVFDTYVTIKDREGHPDMDDTLLEKLDEMLTTYGVPHAFTLPHEKTMEDCPEATLEVAYDSSDDITFSLVYFFHGHELDKRHMIEELGDVAWYLAVLCDAIGSDLDTVMEENLKKLEQRYPEGFDPYRSQHRNELGG